MQTCRKKLHTQNGAAIFYALLLLLFAAMISAVVIAAALTMAHRVTSDKETEQARMTVRSAADYICDDLKDYTYTINEITALPLDAGGNTISSGVPDTRLYFGSSSGTTASKLAPLMDTAIQYVTLNPGSVYRQDFTITLKDADVETVSVHFDMLLQGNAYSAYYTLEHGGTTPYRIYITMKNTARGSGGSVDLTSYSEPYSVGGVTYRATNGNAQIFIWSTQDISTQKRTEGWDML